MKSARAIDVRAAARLFKALGDETRLRIVALLSHGELCVCHLHEGLGLSQPAVSRHLAVLRAAGIVGSRRDRKWVHYRLLPQSSPDCERSLRAVAEAFADRHRLGKEVARLRRRRGPAACA